MNRLNRQSESLPNIAFQNAISDRQSAIVVGCGGLGSHVTSQLVRMGVNVIVVDHDDVEENNLHRTAEFDIYDIGVSKVGAIQRHLFPFESGYGGPSKTNIQSCYHTFAEFVKRQYPNGKFKHSIHSSFPEPSIVIDCSDNMEVRYEIEVFCKQQSLPWIYGAINGKIGMVMLFPENGISFSDFFGRDLKTPESDMRPATKVFPPAVAIVASLQVSEAVKYLNGDKPNQALYAVNLDTYAIQKQIEF